MLPDTDAEGAQHQPHDLLDGDGGGAEERYREGDGPRHHQGGLVRLVDGKGLRQHLGENDDEDRHHAGGVEHPALAEDRGQHAGGEGGSADGDDVVADQHGADEPLARGEDAVDEACPQVAVVLQ